MGHWIVMLDAPKDFLWYNNIRIRRGIFQELCLVDQVMRYGSIRHETYETLTEASRH